jgi:hypothetical protein
VDQTGAGAATQKKFLPTDRFVDQTGPEIPVIIQENKPLLRIVDKCLSPERAQRPTAAALCKMLLRLCRSSVVRGAVLDIGKS